MLTNSPRQNYAGNHAPVWHRLRPCALILTPSIAGLLVASLSKLQNVNAELGAEPVVTADMTVGPAHYPNAQSRQEFFETLASRLRHMPGVEAVAISDTVPPSGFVHSKPLESVQVVGRPALERRPGGIVAWRRVIPSILPPSVSRCSWLVARPIQNIIFRAKKSPIRP